MKSAAIIPTFNKSERVLNVADAALGSENIGLVIVAGNEFADISEQIIDRDRVVPFLDRDLLHRGEALDLGVQRARNLGYESVVFLDPSLTGLRPDHIDKLVRPIIEQDDLMVIGYTGILGSLSRLRSLQIETWDLLQGGDINTLSIEAALNSRVRQSESANRRVARLALSGIYDNSEGNHSLGLTRAIWRNSKAYGAAAFTLTAIKLEQAGPPPHPGNMFPIDSTP